MTNNDLDLIRGCATNAMAREIRIARLGAIR